MEKLKRSKVRFGRKTVEDNPWHATTIEWAAPSPPPHGNFATEPVAYRDPYEYSVPDQESDFLPQFEPDTAPAGEPAKVPA